MTKKPNVKLKTDHSPSTRWVLAPFCFGFFSGSAKYRVEETAQLLKSEDVQSNTTE